MLERIKEWCEKGTRVRIVVNYANQMVRPWEGTISSFDATGLVLKDDRGNETCFTWYTTTEINDVRKR